MNVTQVNSDLARGEDSTGTRYTYTEEINLRLDTDYELTTLYHRALGFLNRAFKKEGRMPEGITIGKLPHFAPSNKLRITIEMVTDEDADVVIDRYEDTAAVPQKPKS